MILRYQNQSDLGGIVDAENEFSSFLCVQLCRKIPYRLSKFIKSGQEVAVRTFSLSRKHPNKTCSSYSVLSVGYPKQ